MQSGKQLPNSCWSAKLPDVIRAKLVQRSWHVPLNSGINGGQRCWTLNQKEQSSQTTERQINGELFATGSSVLSSFMSGTAATSDLHLTYKSELEKSNESFLHFPTYLSKHRMDFCRFCRVLTFFLVWYSVMGGRGYFLNVSNNYVLLSLWGLQTVIMVVFILGKTK